MATTHNPRLLVSSAKTSSSELVHFDTDFLVWALSTRGAERRRFEAVLASTARIEVSSIVWFEFCRGPRTPDQIAVAREAMGAEGIVHFDGALAERAADLFRALGSPRKRAADLAIGVTALVRGAKLLTRNKKDFRGIDGLRIETVEP